MLIFNISLSVLLTYQKKKKKPFKYESVYTNIVHNEKPHVILGDSNFNALACLRSLLVTHFV